MMAETTPDGLHARVRYTEPMVRRAVRVFVWRSLARRGALWGLALGLLGATAALSFGLSRSFGGGLAAAGLLMAACFVATVWRAHFANTVGRFRALRPPEADITVLPSALAIRSSEGAVTVPWTRFTAVWTLPDCWMLFLAPNQFLTLPTADLPPDLVAALRTHLPRPG